MMSLGLTGLINGITTLIAALPNLMVNNELLREKLHGFSFLSIMPIDLVVLIPDIVYMLTVRFILRAENGESAHNG